MYFKALVFSPLVATAHTIGVGVNCTTNNIAPPIAHGYVTPTINHGYAEPSFSRGYAAAIFSRNYAAPTIEKLTPAVFESYKSGKKNGTFS